MQKENTKSNTDYKVKFGIRQKLFFLVLIGFSFLVISTSWLIGYEARKEAKTSISRALAQSSIILETKLNSRFASIEEIVKALSKDGRVFPLIYDKASPTLQDLGLELKKALEFDILIVTDEDGFILARSDRPEAIGQNIANRSALFQSALNGLASNGVISIRGKLLQTVVVPVYDNFAPDVIRGSIALSYELSPQMAEEILALTGSEIGFFLFSRNEQREVSSVKALYNSKAKLIAPLETWFNNIDQRWQEVYDSKASNSNLQIKINNELFLSVSYPLKAANGNNLGFILALQSESELLKPFVRIQKKVILIGLICLLIASAMSWIISRRITRPIINLSKIANRIREGQYPEKHLISKQNDEIDILHNAITHMGVSLKEKAELESYLAQIGEDLDQSEKSFSDNSLFEKALPTNHGETTSPAGDTTIVSDAPPDFDHIKNANLNTCRYNQGDIVANRYSILRLVGAGAMGDVFLAHDKDLDENIAIKVLNQSEFSDVLFKQFKEEIRLARRITHRNILRTFDFGAFQKPYYITMEYVQGYDLGQLIRRKGAFELHIGLTMAKQICTAMHAAHQQGIIHRDLKPANMMITRQGVLKIMDFGLAMKLDTSPAALQEEDQNSNKKIIAGTPRYMAPEQFEGSHLDERTDIYAIGAILFTIFCGRPPFESRSIEELTHLHCTVDAPKLSTLLPDIPEDLGAIVDKALRKKPDQRFNSVRQMLDQLQAI